MNHFDIAFNRTMKIEGDGVLSNNALDYGGETYSGISRVYWPNWKGWTLIDQHKAGNDIDWPLVDRFTREFYRANFWNRIQGNRLSEISPEIAYELFDTAVNVGVTRAVEFLQEAHNVAGKSRYELVVDGIVGPVTIDTIAKYIKTKPGSPELNTEILLNCMNGEQYIFYKLKDDPHHRGWFRRV